jgi:chromosomal replication initiator protein
VESLKTIWTKSLEIIKDNVNNEKAFQTWFNPIVPLKFEGNGFTLQVPSHFFREYIEEHYADLIYATLKRITKLDIVLYYRVIINKSARKGGDTVLMSDHQPNSNREDRAKETKLNKSPEVTVPKTDWNANLNSRFSFNNFFESGSNVVGRRIGKAVADDPTSGKFNPLYIYGIPGVGKTHLCHAIGNHIVDLYPERKVIYISSHLFQVQFTDASRNNTTNDFMHFYHGVDVLIIDDIQELSGKEKTQNAYFNIFNNLRLLGKQIIITSDRAPMEMQGVEERLTSRFNSGALIELFPPDLELRRKILNHKVAQDGLKISGEIIDYIAENVTEHIRDLEGIITSLMAHSLACNCDVDLELTKRVVSKVIRMERKPITPEHIQNVVSNFFKVDIKDIQSKSRKKEIVEARHVAMHLTKKYTNCSYTLIGKLIGKRDHASVLHADNSILTRLSVDKTFRITMSNLESILNR